MLKKFIFLKFLILISAIVACSVDAENNRNRDVSSDSPAEEGLHIANGEPANWDEFAYFARLQFADGSPFCGATIVGEYTLLTAAHCLYVEGRVGEVLKSKNQIKIAINRGNGDVEELDVMGFKIHHGFKRHEVTNSLSSRSYEMGVWSSDLALVYTEQNIGLNPVQMANNSIMAQLRDNAKAGDRGLTVIGNGSDGREFIDQTEDSSSDFNKTTMNFVELGSCNSRGVTGDFPRDVICTQPGQGFTLYGDSGGPLLFRHNGGFYQVGVVSSGIFGANFSGQLPNLFYGLFSGISFRLDWINRYKDAPLFNDVMTISEFEALVYYQNQLSFEDSNNEEKILFALYGSLEVNFVFSNIASYSLNFECSGPEGSEGNDLKVWGVSGESAYVSHKCSENFDREISGHLVIQSMKNGVEINKITMTAE